MNDKELMQRIHVVLEKLRYGGDPKWADDVLPDLEARLAQPEPEPVAWADKCDIDREGHDFHVSRQQPAKGGVPLYTTPPQRKLKEENNA